LIMRLEDDLGIMWPVEQLAEHEKFARVGELRSACRTLTATAPEM
jgi:acyl carrier protein